MAIEEEGDRHCDTCGKLEHFERAERGRAWFGLEVWDGGDDEPTIAASFCSLACLNQFFRSPENAAFARSADERCTRCGRVLERNACTHCDLRVLS